MDMHCHQTLWKDEIIYISTPFLVGIPEQYKRLKEKFLYLIFLMEETLSSNEEVHVSG